jgi:hypothetical protein
VPLFVEELTKSVLESGLLREKTDRYVLDRALPPLERRRAIPRRGSIFHPEDRARQTIDAQLTEAGWVVQSRAQMNLGAGFGVALREFSTATGPEEGEAALERAHRDLDTWRRALLKAAATGELTRLAGSKPPDGDRRRSSRADYPA